MICSASSKRLLQLLADQLELEARVFGLCWFRYWGISRLWYTLSGECQTTSKALIFSLLASYLWHFTVIRWLFRD